MAANDAKKPILYWVTLVTILVAFCAVASTARTERPSASPEPGGKLKMALPTSGKAIQRSELLYRDFTHQVFAGNFANVRVS
jgi:hypothetical protein